MDLVKNCHFLIAYEVRVSTKLMDVKLSYFSVRVRLFFNYQ
jgi:hypothetical protein